LCLVNQGDTTHCYVYVCINIHQCVSDPSTQQNDDDNGNNNNGENDLYWIRPVNPAAKNPKTVSFSTQLFSS